MTEHNIELGRWVILCTPLFLTLLVIPNANGEDSFDQLTTFQSGEYGFSIQYPENWVVYDEVVEVDTGPGYDEGFFSIVYFADDPNLVTHSIEITYAKNDNIARNNQGQQYLDRVEVRLTENCEVALFEINGYQCSYFKATNSEITEHNGLPAYKFTQTWTESYPDGSVLDVKRILVDIVDENDVWTIDGVSIESEFPKFSNTLEEIIESFSLQTIEESKLPGELESENQELTEENDELESIIRELEKKIEDLNVIIMEQIKVIYEWIIGK